MTFPNKKDFLKEPILWKGSINIYKYLLERNEPLLLSWHPHTLGLFSFAYNLNFKKTKPILVLHFITTNLYKKSLSNKQTKFIIIDHEL